LEQPYTYTWSLEKPAVSEGLIVVLEVDPELARPRQVDMPVLFVGPRPAELANVGYPSGRMIVIVPGPLDLTQVPIYFGSTILPEQVDAEHGAQEMAEALASGIRPFESSRIEVARSRGGAPLRVRSIEGIYRSIADLIDTHAPDEAERAADYRRMPAE